MRCLGPNLARLAVTAATAAALLVGLSVAASAAQTTTSRGAPAPVIAAGAAHSAAGGTAVCAAPTSPLQARCLTLLKPAAQQAALRASAPTAKIAGNRAAAAAADLPVKDLGATDLENAYGLTPALLSTHGKGQTIGIVDAYGYPQAEADLAVYRSRYGLPACTIANGCLRQLDQRGTTTPAPTPPAGQESWQLETALDLDMASAACPQCSILLVEADDSDLNNLGASEDTAVAAGASDVSNSYGSPEQGGLDPYNAHWTHPGTPILVASGDGGFGVPGYPAVLPTTVAVGGTELVHASNTRGFSETAWSYAGSGCSAYFAKPSWQPGTHCSMRSTADVSAASDNIIIYNSTFGGLAVVAGTSASTPFIAGVVGLAGNAKTYTAKYSYQHASKLHDVVGGSSAQPGATCGTDYLCNGVKGYDGPTGVGTPNGTGGF